MVKRNTGKGSEAQFEAMFQQEWGKQGFLYRFEDTGDFMGRTGIRQALLERPADFFFATPKATGLLEVKSTVKMSLSCKSSLQPGQLSAGKRMVAAGGLYIVAVHFKTPNKWLLFKFEDFLRHKSVSPLLPQPSTLKAML